MLWKNRLLQTILLLSLPSMVAAVESIKIGLIGPYTGGSSPMGLSMRNGVRLAAMEVNRNGGVLGRTLVLVERDDQARPEHGVLVARELIAKEKVVAALGFVNTGVALASQRYYQDAKIPAITNVATGSMITRQFLPPQYVHNYIFRVASSGTIQAPMIVSDAVDKHKFTRVAIFADATNYGQSGREDLEKELARRGLKPVVVEKFNIKNVDMTAQLLRAQAAGAQVLLTYGIGPELAQLANGMARLGWRVPIIGSAPLSMDNFIDHAGPHAEGARMPQTFIQEPNTPQRKAFIAAYQEHYRVQRIPYPIAAAQGYDSLNLLVAAIRQAASTDGPKIRTALENLRAPVAGVITTYVRPFSHDDHEAITADIAVMGEVKGGRVVYAYEEDRKRQSIPNGR